MQERNDSYIPTNALGCAIKGKVFFGHGKKKIGQLDHFRGENISILPGCNKVVRCHGFPLSDDTLIVPLSHFLWPPTVGNSLFHKKSGMRYKSSLSEVV